MNTKTLFFKKHYYVPLKNLLMFLVCLLVTFSFAKCAYAETVDDLIEYMENNRNFRLSLLDDMVERISKSDTMSSLEKDLMIVGLQNTTTRAVETIGEQLTKIRKLKSGEYTKNKLLQEWLDGRFCLLDKRHQALIKFIPDGIKNKKVPKLFTAPDYIEKFIGKYGCIREVRADIDEQIRIDTVDLNHQTNYLIKLLLYLQNDNSSPPEKLLSETLKYLNCLVTIHPFLRDETDNSGYPDYAIYSFETKPLEVELYREYLYGIENDVDIEFQYRNLGATARDKTKVHKKRLTKDEFRIYSKDSSAKFYKDGKVIIIPISYNELPPEPPSIDWNTVVNSKLIATSSSSSSLPSTNSASEKIAASVSTSVSSKDASKSENPANLNAKSTTLVNESPIIPASSTTATTNVESESVGLAQSSVPTSSSSSSIPTPSQESVVKSDSYAHTSETASTSSMPTTATTDQQKTCASFDNSSNSKSFDRSLERYERKMWGDIGGGPKTFIC